MNIMLTTNCNRRECGFCFEQSVPEMKASEHSGSLRILDRGNSQFITAGNYAYLLRLAQEWKSPRICLLGGEPTQHQMIGAFVAGVLRIGKQVLVATNGVIHPPRSNDLRRILYSEEGRGLLFLLNPYLRGNQPRGELTAIENNLGWMQTACTLSITVWDEEFDLLPYASLISRFNLNTIIRVSLAHPMVDHENTFAAATDYRRIGAALKKAGRLLLRQGIRLFCDCGFVACMFADGSGDAAIRNGLMELRECGILFRSACNPLLDIHPDLSASHCLPLSSRKRIQLDPAIRLDRSDAVQRMEREFPSHSTRFLFPECESCGLRRAGECTAGCLAHRIRLQEADCTHAG